MSKEVTCLTQPIYSALKKKRTEGKKEKTSFTESIFLRGELKPFDSKMDVGLMHFSDGGEFFTTSSNKDTLK